MYKLSLTTNASAGSEPFSSPRPESRKTLPQEYGLSSSNDVSKDDLYRRKQDSYQQSFDDRNSRPQNEKYNSMSRTPSNPQLTNSRTYQRPSHHVFHRNPDKSPVHDYDDDASIPASIPAYIFVGKKVQFDVVDIRYYETILSDHPDVRSGPSLGIGWRFKWGGTFELKEWEDRKSQTKTSDELVYTRRQREQILKDLGYSQREMAEMVRSINKIKWSRQRTVQTLGYAEFDEALESFGKKLRSITKLGPSRGVDQHVHEYVKRCGHTRTEIDSSTDASVRSSTRSIIREGPRDHNFSVSFTMVNVRLYETILGDHPDCRSGPSLGIGWQHMPENVYTVEDWENKKKYQRTSDELVYSRDERIDILKEWGYSQSEIAAGVRAVNKIRFSRQRTVQTLGFTNFEEKVESVRRMMPFSRLAR